MVTLITALQVWKVVIHIVFLSNTSRSHDWAQLYLLLILPSFTALLIGHLLVWLEASSSRKGGACGDCYAVFVIEWMLVDVVPLSLILRLFTDNMSFFELISFKLYLVF